MTQFSNLSQKEGAESKVKEIPKFHLNLHQEIIQNLVEGVRTAKEKIINYLVKEEVVGLHQKSTSNR